MVADEGGAGQDRRESGGTVIRLGLSTILSLVFVCVAAFVLAYIGGVMSGRHLVVSERAEAARSPQKEAPETVPGEEAEAGRDILPARDLEFARVLRGQSAQPPAIPKKSPAVEAAPAEAAKENDKPESVSPGGESPADPAALYDYVFQAAAFRDEEGADGLRQTLEGHGLRTRLERKGRLFVVLIMLRGNEGRANEVLGLARELKLGDMVLRSRKEAPR